MSDEINYSTMPNRGMQYGIQNYLEHGQPVGGFLTALLSNDLKETCSRADSTNAQLIYEWVKWLYNNAPGSAWGSPQRVAEWMSHRGLEFKLREEEDDHE